MVFCKKKVKKGGISKNNQAKEDERFKDKEEEEEREEKGTRFRIQGSNTNRSGGKV